MGTEFILRLAEAGDEAFWRSLESHCTAQGFQQKISGDRAFLILRWGEPAGVLEYALLWDRLPFLNSLVLLPKHRGQGGGRLAMEQWERRMKRAGYPMALVSTQADESAQHFYRKLGYRDCGCLLLNQGPLAQPAELFFCKIL